MVVQQIPRFSLVAAASMNAHACRRRSRSRFEPHTHIESASAGQRDWATEGLRSLHGVCTLSCVVGVTPHIRLGSTFRILQAAGLERWRSR